MVVTVEFFLASVDSVFVLIQFLFVLAGLHFLLGHVFQQTALVDLVEEHFAPDEGESDCQEDGDDGGPGHNSRSSGVAHTDKDGVEKRME